MYSFQLRLWSLLMLQALLRKQGQNSFSQAGFGFGFGCGCSRTNCPRRCKCVAGHMSRSTTARL